MVDLSKITKNGKALFLAYDQGMEHGTADFDGENIDPSHILKIGIDGGFTGIIFQKGVAEKYFNQSYKEKLPLIIKLNGKTNLVKTQEPYSPLLCTVDEAVKLGASAVGYTIYIGSEYEEQMLKELAEVIRQAHDKNIPVIGWMYPRGKNVPDPLDQNIISYGARVGLEVGCDLVKVNYPGSLEGVKHIVAAAGKTGVVFAGGKKDDENTFLEMAKTVMESGAVGMAVGRNIWQSDNPMDITEKLKKIIFKK
ncbi:MAG: fructose-bisphosphate aldolase [Candidatus Levybacteria bacterium RIFCSPLOWO2_02_FULL_36_8b]|nr:MAG: fructose-bisphosphate aldolase [Candidatus Levybacteria bacterium RIFCSPLOWO2_02_FULL_36_8b]